MVGKAKRTPERKYAVAVRDGDLFLFLSVSRSHAGDVYVNFPRDQVEKYEPHSSYHASGQHHQKAFEKKALVKHQQKPNSNFQGTENVLTTSIASEEPRAVNTLCKVEEFQEVFEIPISDLRPEKGRTMISIDIMEARGEPTTSPGATIVRQVVFQDSIPWLVATLFDNGESRV